ncbi:MAG: hypothetical protein GW754_04450 [Candidatus Pacebacteria bacterium]|nr:hypothetical protein [Candidatus Paceibacterota bacterium]NCS86641.1 hypothetical protein [Candidatus Paceibacterota bacterium]
MPKQFIVSLIFFTFSLVFLPYFNFVYATEEASGGKFNESSQFNIEQYRTYNTKGYPDFDDKFYITPIKNIIQGNGPSEPTVEGEYKDIRLELAMTGYETYCMAENVEINPQYNTEKLIDLFLYYNPQGINLHAFSTEVLGMKNANYPIWRDLDGRQFLMNSLEEYFGFKDVYEKDPAKSEVNSAAINSLLSQEQACVQGWITLGAERRACNRLQDISTCQLTKRMIPGGGFEVHDIMGMLSDFTGGGWAGGDAQKGEELAIKWCNILFSEPPDPNDSELNTVQKALVKPIKETIINVPTYRDKGYRIGFIVAAMETRQPFEPASNPEEATQIFNFFTPKTEDKEWDEVLVAAFKLPDIGTNKGPGSLFGQEKWDDPLDLTRLVLTTDEAHKTQEGLGHSEREAALNGAIAAQEQTPESRIYCYDGIFPGGNGTNSCLLPLPKALTDFINSKRVDCENDAEAAKEISDLAGLRDASDTYGKLFTKANGGQVLVNLFLGSPYNAGGASPDLATLSNIETIWTIREPIWKPQVNNSLVHFYLVYPVGYELETVEEAIKGTFFTQAQIAQMNEDKSIINNFEVTGQTQALDGGKVSWKFEDTDWIINNPGDCGYEKDEFGEVIIPKVPIICKERPSIGIKQDGGKIDILGSRLSWWLRKVQVALSSKFSIASKYYGACKTMEEFLLGRCIVIDSVGGDVDPETVAAVAQCNEVTPGACDGITSGETAVHVPAPGTCPDPTVTPNMYVPALHEIPAWFDPNDPAPVCNDDFYSYIACTYPNTLVANPVNEEGVFVASSNMTACEFVVNKAKELGFSPRFALSMWAEETGMSHIRTSKGAFGITPTVAEPFHLGQQMDALYGTMWHWKDSYQNFLEKYSDEELNSNKFCTNPFFPARLFTYYWYLHPNSFEPCNN